MERGVASRKERAAGRLAAAVARLDALSPLAVLTRGYALVQRAEDGAVVRAASDVGLGAGLRIRLARGSLEARVSALHEPASDEESPQN